MESVKCIAVDWSGEKYEKGQLEGIWLAVAESNSLIRLKNGLTRDEVIAMLVEEIKSAGPLFIGLDFAFSFPQWFLDCHQLQSVNDLWQLAANKGEIWLTGETWPFWGKDNTKYQKCPEELEDHLQFRQTDEDHRSSNIKSVFQISGGAGTVGTGTIRGLPKLSRLQEAGAAIWPFDVPNPDGPNVIELYPRLFYRRAVTNNMSVSGRNSRQSYLDKRYPRLEGYWRDVMIGSDDAFDAGISALAMSAYAKDLQKLKPATQSPKILEGEIWSPS